MHLKRSGKPGDKKKASKNNKKQANNVKKLDRYKVSHSSGASVFFYVIDVFFIFVLYLPASSVFLCVLNTNSYIYSLYVQIVIIKLYELSL